MTRLAPPAGIVVFIAALAFTRPPAGDRAGASQPMEGTFEYVGTLKGQSIMAGNRFVFLYGPADGSGAMTGEAGTYRIARDTAVHTITYSTSPERVGTTFMWTPESWKGDTVSYVVMNAQRQLTGRGRSVRRR